MNNCFAVRQTSGLNLPRKFVVMRGSRYDRFNRDTDIIGYLWQVSKHSWRWEVRARHFHDRKYGRATTKSQALTRLYREYTGR